MPTITVPSLPNRRFVKLSTAALLTILVSAAAAIEPADEAFHFVVLGDSQFHDPPTFNRIIDSARALQPAFVVQVGDLITGYTADPDELSNQWQRFRQQIAPLQEIPFLAVPGNHDLSGPDKKSHAATKAIFEENWGRTYRAINYANALLLVLSTEEVAEENRIDEKQWRWLSRTLTKNNEEHVFVFMHRPPGNLVNAKALNQLFVENGVSHVFYGHHHHYHFTEEDGVKYYMTNAAANGMVAFDEAGGFDHLLQVSVRDEDVSVAVIRADAIIAEDAVTPEDNYELFAIQRQLARTDMTANRQSERAWQLDLKLRNPSKRAINLYMQCASPDGRWQISPKRLPMMGLAPQSNQQLRLEFSFAADRVPEGDPTCEVTLPFQSSRGSWLHEAVKLPVLISR